MKVYVAAPWTQKNPAAAIALMLEQRGHTITKKWWEHQEVPGYLHPDISDEALAELQQQAIEDANGVADCDVFFLLNIEKSEGKAVETGFAIAYNKILIGVGVRSNLFHYDPLFDWFDNLYDALNRISPTLSTADTQYVVTAPTL